MTSWHGSANTASNTCRYVYHTLRNSKQAVDTIDEADVVYVYDYCYMMWLLADHHARQHWWLRTNYEPPSGTGSNLLAVYRHVPPLQFLTCFFFSLCIAVLIRQGFWIGYTAIAHTAAECHCDQFKGEPSRPL